MKALQIFTAFILFMILGYFAVGFADSAQKPTAGTAAYNQSVNLSKAVNISNTGIQAVMLILMLAMVLASVLFLFLALKRRR